MKFHVNSALQYLHSVEVVSYLCPERGTNPPHFLLPILLRKLESISLYVLP
jgi:hypothetical protein